MALKPEIIITNTLPSAQVKLNGIEIESVSGTGTDLRLANMFVGAKGEKGDKGDKGDQGIQGIQGERGEAAVVTVETLQEAEVILQVVNPVVKVINGEAVLPIVPMGRLIFDAMMIFTNADDNDVIDYELNPNKDYVVIDMHGVKHVEGVIQMSAEYENKYVQVSYVVWQ
jgi:hypothetical protein